MLLRCALMAPLLLSLAPAPARAGQQLTYLRRADKVRLKTKIAIWAAKGGHVITKKNADEYVRIECDRRWATRRWVLRSKRYKARVTAVRRGNTIHFKGTVEGEPVDEQLQIDGLPWYQDIGFNAKPFILSGRKSMRFWSVHPGKKEAYKMQITKVGRGTLTLAGQRVPTVKTKLVVDKFMVRSLWAGYHWHRASDGLFVRYTSKGKLGAPDIDVTILSGL